MKWMFPLSGALLLALLTVPAAFAADVQGKTLFRADCRSCHVDGGSAQDLSPADYLKSEWRDFFANDHHQQQPNAWKGISAKDLAIIQQWLIDHAMDSDQAATCG